MDRLINIEADWTTPPTRSPRLNELHRYWRESRGKHARPSRGDIRPADMVPILRNVFLVDVGANGDFRFRLAGSHFTENTGLPMAGSSIASVFPELFCREVREAWSHCARQSAPTLGRGRFWIPERDFLNWEGVVLPLSEPDQPVNMLFGAIEFQARH
jgi:hypothetical protein